MDQPNNMFIHELEVMLPQGSNDVDYMPDILRPLNLSLYQTYRYSSGKYMTADQSLTTLTCPLFFMRYNYTKSNRCALENYIKESPIAHTIMMPWLMNNQRVEFVSYRPENKDMLQRFLMPVSNPPMGYGRATDEYMNVRRINIVETYKMYEQAADTYTDLMSEDYYDENLSKMIRPTPRTRAAVFFNPDFPNTLTVCIYKLLPEFVCKILGTSEALFHVPNPEKEYSPDIFKEVFKMNYNTWYGMITEFITPYLESYIIDNMKSVFLNFMHGYEDTNISNVRNRIGSIQSEIHDYENTLASSYRTLKDEQERLFAAENMGSTIDYEAVYKYIKNKPEIKVMKPINSSTLAVAIVTEFRYFDDEVLAIHLKNDRAAINTSGLAPIFKDVFIDKTYKMVVRAAMQINFTGCNVSNCTQIWETYIQQNGLPNPHIMRFNCFGNNSPVLSKAVKEGSFEILFEYMISSASNINFSDSAVVNHFVEVIKNDRTLWTKKCLLDKDGNLHTLKEIYPNIYNSRF